MANERINPINDEGDIPNPLLEPVENTEETYNNAYNNLGDEGADVPDDLNQNGIDIDSDIDYTQYSASKVSREEAIKRSEKTAEMFANIYATYLPKLAKGLIKFDKVKMEIMAINNEIDLDEKIQIGEDTIMTAREYISQFNEQVEDSLSIDEEIKNGFKDAAAEVLAEAEVSASPTSRLITYGALGIFSLATTSFVLYSHKKQILEILSENKTKKTIYEKEIERLKQQLELERRKNNSISSSKSTYSQNNKYKINEEIDDDLYLEEEINNNEEDGYVNEQEYRANRERNRKLDDEDYIDEEIEEQIQKIKEEESNVIKDSNLTMKVAHSEIGDEDDEDDKEVNNKKSKNKYSKSNKYNTKYNKKANKEKKQPKKVEPIVINNSGNNEEDDDDITAEDINAEIQKAIKNSNKDIEKEI